jgi:hypothetical protein
VRNEIETKRNETKRNQRKRNETKRNQRKQNETKRNQRNGNEMKRNQRKQNEITNKNMTFELLKVCRQANPAWVELQVMYVRSTVTDRHARWVIINQNYCI